MREATNRYVNIDEGELIPNNPRSLESMRQPYWSKNLAYCTIFLSSIQFKVNTTLRDDISRNFIFRIIGVAPRNPDGR